MESIRPIRIPINRNKKSDTLKDIGHDQLHKGYPYESDEVGYLQRD
jgi:hypothetical protein